jgi:hypothetical protein
MDGVFVALLTTQVGRGSGVGQPLREVNPSRYLEFVGTLLSAGGRRAQDVEVPILN